MIDRNLIPVIMQFTEIDLFYKWLFASKGLREVAISMLNNAYGCEIIGKKLHVFTKSRCGLFRFMNYWWSVADGNRIDDISVCANFVIARRARHEIKSNNKVIAPLTIKFDRKYMRSAPLDPPGSTFVNNIKHTCARYSGNQIIKIIIKPHHCVEFVGNKITEDNTREFVHVKAKAIMMDEDCSYISTDKFGVLYVREIRMENTFNTKYISMTSSDGCITCVYTRVNDSRLLTALCPFVCDTSEESLQWFK